MAYQTYATPRKTADARNDMSDQNTDPQAPNASAQPPAQPPAPPAPAPTAPAPITMTTEQLNERMERYMRSQLKGMGIDDPSVLQDRLKKAQELEAEAEKRRREQMSREEQLQSDLAAAQQRAQEAENARLAAEFDHQVATVCAALGIKNVDYAAFQVVKAVEGDSSVDPRAFLEERLKDNAQRSAFGVEQPVQTQGVPATTQPEGNQPTPPTNTPPPKVDAMKMSDAEWQAHKATLGI